MNRFDLLKQVDISLAARLIVELGNMFQDNSEALEEHLSDEVTEEELHQINDAAQKRKITVGLYLVDSNNSRFHWELPTFSTKSNMTYKNFPYEYVRA